MNKKDGTYLPKVRSDYKSPCSDDPIVVNNIAYSEFDYTENLTDDENLDLPQSKNSKKS